MEHIGTLSYGLAALAFAFLTVLLAVSWRGRLAGGLLLAATLATTVWATAIASTIAIAKPLGGWGLVLEFARGGLWLAFLAVLLAQRAPAEALPRIKRRGLVGAVLVALCATVALLGARIGLPGVARFAAHLASLAFALAGIALIEQLYRNASEESRWAIKHFCLGLGAAFAYDFYLYASALLFGVPDPQVWQARGFAHALVVPLIAVSAARNPEWSLDVHVSRRVVFHTTTLLAGGLYLLAMAAAGYYIRYFGGSWGGVLQSAFFFGALVVLAAVIFSGTVRARLRVFLSKHFFSYKYDYREAWLRFTRALSEGEPGTAVRERSLRAVASLVDSPGALLFMAGEGGVYEPAAGWNTRLPPTGLGNDASLVRFLRARQWVVDLGEWASSPELYGDLELPEWLASMDKAWLVVPLMLHEDLVGFMVLLESSTHAHFDWEDADLLKTAGRQAAVHLVQAQAMESLAQARQFESFNRFSAFVVHDLKNVVAQLSLMLENAHRHKDNPQFQADMLETVRHATERMTCTLSQLRTGYPSAQGARLVDLDELLARVVADKGVARPRPSYSGPDHPVWVLAEKERLARVLGHLVQNAIEATPPDGRVEVSLFEEDDRAVVSVRDTGCGMDEDFLRHRLFKPFASTKAAGMGIGSYECREYVRELKGEIEVQSQPGAGSVFTVRLPRVMRTPVGENRFIGARS